jgi:inward rectifier potassium channel
MGFMNFGKKKTITATAKAAKNSSKIIEAGSSSDEEFDDLGLGGNFNTRGRFILPNGEFNIERRGLGLIELNIYQWLVTTSWTYFFGVILLFYILSNVIFALLFLSFGIESISGVIAGSSFENFVNSFFFSVQTFTTVGYGSMSPKGWGANIVAALNALFGLMSFALATGLFFARFARPAAKVRFSKNALIAPYNDIRGFMFRMVNLRSNQLMDVEVQLVITWLEYEQAKTLRRFRRLELERNKVAMFPLNWTVVHPIDETSPLYQKSKEELIKMDVEFIISMKGYDDTFAQNVKDHYSYKYEEMVIGAKFNPMYHVNEEGLTVLEVDKIDDYDRVTLSS